MPNRKCGHWIGVEDRRCGSAEVRRYLVGDRCALHTPAQLGAGDDWWRNAPNRGGSD